MPLVGGVENDVVLEEEEVDVVVLLLMARREFKSFFFWCVCFSTSVMQMKMIYYNSLLEKAQFGL